MVLNAPSKFKTTSTTTTRKYTTLQKKHLTNGTMNHSKKLPDENKFKPNLNLTPYSFGLNKKEYYIFAFYYLLYLIRASFLFEHWGVPKYIIYLNEE